MIIYFNEENFDIDVALKVDLVEVAYYLKLFHKKNFICNMIKKLHRRNQCFILQQLETYIII